MSRSKIKDRIGNPVSIGDVIIYAPKSGGLNIGVFAGTDKTPDGYRAKIVMINWMGNPKLIRLYPVIDYALNSAVLVQNPGFYIDNEEVRKCLEMADDIVEKNCKRIKKVDNDE